MANPFDTLLGLGFAGYAIIDDQPLLLSPSNIEEADNLLKSTGSITNLFNYAGEIPVIDRRALNKTISVVCTPSALKVIGSTCLDWRKAGSVGRTSRVSIRVANDQGYDSDEAFLQTITISAQSGSLITISFTFVSWQWIDTDDFLFTPREQKKIDPILDILQPIPHWDSKIVHDAQEGVGLTWSVQINNQWGFKQFLEASVEPNPPGVAYAGPLLFDLNYSTLAKSRIKPGRKGSAKIIIGGGKPGNKKAKQSIITIPLLIREPSRSIQGVGNQDNTINWAVVWRAIGEVPYIEHDTNFIFE